MLYRSCSNARIYSSTIKNIEEGIEKHQLLVSMCSAFFSPFIGALCLIIFEMRWQKDDDSDGSSEIYVNVMILTSMIQTVLIHVISFVPYKYENQDYRSCMNRCTVKLHYSITILLFVISPVFNMLVYLIMLISGSESGLLFSYMAFYATVSALILVSFLILLLEEFTILKQDHLTDICQAKEAQNILNQQSGTDGIDDKEEYVNEHVLKQSANQITKIHPLREDMFSMLFVTALRPEYMLYCSMKLSEDNKEQNEID